MHRAVSLALARRLPLLPPADGPLSLLSCAASVASVVTWQWLTAASPAVEVGLTKYCIKGSCTSRTLPPSSSLPFYILVLLCVLHTR